MALTTAGAFTEFVSKISLTEPQRITVGSRRTKTHEYLSTSFGPDTDMRLLRTSLIG